MWQILRLQAAESEGAASKQQGTVHLLEHVPDACGALHGAKPVFGCCSGGAGGGHALDAVERHDAVLESHFELGFRLLHLLLAYVGLPTQRE